MQPPVLELAFSVRMEFDDGPRLRFAPAGLPFRRGFVAVRGGTITGSRLSGRVLPQSGGDWPRLWPNGLIEFEAHYLLEADDGTPIYVHNRGLAWSSPEVLARIEAGERVRPDETYCRITPRFEAPAGPHEWLTRTVFVGCAERDGAQTAFDYYAVL
ncbi:DUF3237 family protein [bacterium]|nr:MAG: DUF3237 family protein [bacterium]